MTKAAILIDGGYFLKAVVDSPARHRCVSSDLSEHIDGLTSGFPRPR